MNYMNCGKYKWNELGVSTRFQPVATGEREQVIPQRFRGEAPAHDPTPYHFLHHFDRKGTPFVYFLLKIEKGTPFKYPRKNAAPFF